MTAIEQERSPTVWSSEFEATLRKFLMIPSDRQLAPHESLVQLGLDSMGAVSALLELEQVFSVTFTDDQLVPETFATPQGLWLALSSLPAQTR
jgi:acyl carrier protein